jgi:hypothetical protein
MGVELIVHSSCPSSVNKHLAERPSFGTHPALAATHTANGLVKSALFYHLGARRPTLRVRRRQHLSVMSHLEGLSFI